MIILIPKIVAKLSAREGLTSTSGQSKNNKGRPTAIKTAVNHGYPAINVREILTPHRCSEIHTFAIKISRVHYLPAGGSARRRILLYVTGL